MPTIVDLDPQVRAAASSGSQINGLFTSTSSMDKLICVGIIEGGENPESSNAATFEAGALTLITGADTGNTGNNNDVRILVYETDDPGDVTNGDTVFDWQFGGAPALAIWIGINDCSQINVIDTDVNTTASSTTVLSSGGGSASSFLCIGAAQGSDMNPSSVSNSYVEATDGEGQSGATTSDFAHNVSLLESGGPAAATITWNTTDQNTGILLELVPNSSNATPTLTGVSGTGAVGTLTTSIPSIGVSLVGVSGTGAVGTLGVSAGQPGGADEFGIQIEGGTDVLLQENGDKILLEATELPDVIVVSGFLRKISRSSLVSSSAKITITRTVRLVSDTGNLIPMTGGSSLDVIYNIVDEDGNAVDLTGGSISWSVKTSGTDNAVITKTSPSGGVALTTPGSGVATVTLDPSDTSSLSGTYTLDGQFTDSGANVYTFEDGGLRIR